MKWFGIIGYADTQETSPGVWEEVITEREYYGDLLQITRRWEGAQQVNDNLNISNKISVVLDPYLSEHFHTIRYVTFHNAKWKVTTAEVRYPRIELTIGGVYNEQTES